MPQPVDINVNDDVLDEDAYGFDALASLESSDAIDGTYVQVDTATIHEGDTQVRIWDPNGTAATWYRVQYLSADQSLGSEYEDPFQAGSPQAYATLEDLLERLSLPNESRNNLLADLLVSSARYIDTRTLGGGADFLRHPGVSGSETRIFDVPVGRDRFSIWPGIVSVDSVSLASATGEDLVELDSAEWYLEPRTLTAEGNYSGIVLLSTGTYPRFYAGQGVLQIAGAFGWARPPAIVKEANLAHAARSYHEWRTKQAGPVGNPDFGGTIPLTPYLPDVVYRCIEIYSRWRAGDET